MKARLHLFFILCFTTLYTNAQTDEFIPSLTIGDPAPHLKVREWLKGVPLKTFEKGKLYAVEFWATWCQPCKAAMPRLSKIARRYKQQVTFIGIDVYETRPMQVVRAFVDSMQADMDYLVAAQDSNYMAEDWLEASGERAIPGTFVVNREGKIAWIGHPKDLDNILPDLVDNRYNVDSALLKRIKDKQLYKLDQDAMYDLIQYRGDPMKPGDPGKPDSVIAAVNRMVEKEPRLKYAPMVAYNTFVSLLKTKPERAYEFGKTLMVTSSYESPPLYIIVDGLKNHSASLLLPREIYILGAEALELEIKQYPYPELINVAKRYDQVAEWYWKAGEKQRAIETQEKAIELLLCLRKFGEKDLAGYTFRLQQYKKM